MKALSIQQPWAWLIVNGFKNIENRNWNPHNPGLKFRGTALIHTGKNPDKDFDYEHFSKIIGQKIPYAATMPLGGVVGKADFVGVTRDSPSPWFFGPYGLILKNAEPLPYFFYKGMLGFFNIEYPTPTQETKT